mmetsp:Transcript_31864/g.32111  ORF Transcript_31864/g.32111 Transcript_31864/m.32111 type:complete len:96 (+) Transcript_31864:217-504(+)
MIPGLDGNTWLVSRVGLPRVTSCIYLHDRGDTLAGWQIKKQWEDQKKAVREKKEKGLNAFMFGASGLENDNGKITDDDGLPFACHICRNFSRTRL